MIQRPEARIKRAGHRGSGLDAYQPGDFFCRDAPPRILRDIMQGEWGRHGGAPSSILRMDRLLLGAKRRGLAGRGQSSMLDILRLSVVLERVAQRLQLQALPLCLLAVDKGVLGVCRDVSL